MKGKVRTNISQPENLVLGHLLRIVFSCMQLSVVVKQSIKMYFANEFSGGDATMRLTR